MLILYSLLFIMVCFSEYQLGRMLTNMHIFDEKNKALYLVGCLSRLIWVIVAVWFAIDLPIYLLVLFLLLYSNAFTYRSHSAFVTSFIMMIILLYMTLFMLVICMAGSFNISFSAFLENNILHVLLFTVAFALYNLISFSIFLILPDFDWEELDDRRKMKLYVCFLIAGILYQFADSFLITSYDISKSAYLLMSSGNILILILMFLLLTYNHVIYKSEMVKKEYEESEILMAQQYFEKEELKVLSEHDSLTSAYNRREICSLMQKYMAEGHRLLSVFIDLDGLKRINDTYGHTYGDRMLKHFADACSLILQGMGDLARIGGDEFLLVFCDQDVEEVEQRIQLLQIELLKPQEEKDKISFSYGISYNELTVEDYINVADQKMYECKKRKKRNTL